MISRFSPFAPAALVFMVAASQGCTKQEAPLFGVRLGDAMSTAREHLVTPGQGTWESEAGKVPALTWTPVSSSSPLRRARLEFHKGALVAARYVVSRDAPEAKGDPFVLTSVQATAREDMADGARSIVVLSLDCPEHADEVKALLQRAKPSRLAEVDLSLPASNFRDCARDAARRRLL